MGTKATTIGRMAAGAVALALLFLWAGEGVLAPSAAASPAKETAKPAAKKSSKPADKQSSKTGAKAESKSGAKAGSKTGDKTDPSAKPGKSAKPVPRARPADAPTVDACTACLNALDAKVAACRVTIPREVKPRNPRRHSGAERKAEAARKTVFNGCLKIADDGIVECQKTAHCER